MQRAAASAADNKTLPRINVLGAWAIRLRATVASFAGNAAALRTQWHWFLVALFLILVILAPAYWSRLLWFSNDSFFWFQPWIPFLAVWSVWHWRRDLQRIHTETLRLPETSPQRRGKVWPLVVGCVVMLIAYATQFPGLSILAWVIMTLGVVSYAFGRTIRTYLLPELILVVTMIPPPLTLVTQFQYGLMMGMAGITGNLLRIFGQSGVVVSGNYVEVGKRAIEVTANISGGTILVPLLAATLWLIVLHRYSVKSAVTLFTLAAVLGLVVITARVILLALLARADQVAALQALVAAPAVLYVLPVFGLLWFLAAKLRLR